MDTDIPIAAGGRDLLPSEHHRPGRAAPPAARGASPPIRAPDAETAVSVLYRAHAVGLIRLAVVMIADRPAAEDIVQEAFCGLFRRWGRLADPGKALTYVRSSVLNGCRTEIRRRISQDRHAARAGRPAASAASAEYEALLGEEHREVVAALRLLPRRQHEALVLRFFLDLSEPEIAAVMSVSQGTVKSTTSRALGALSRLLEEKR
jgi:RNA polymerase sigma-70 factor (sigma-E family)